MAKVARACLAECAGQALRETASRVASDIIRDFAALLHHRWRWHWRWRGRSAAKLRLPKPNQPRKEWPETPLARWFVSNPAHSRCKEFHGAVPPMDPFMYLQQARRSLGLNVRKWLEEMATFPTSQSSRLT